MADKSKPTISLCMIVKNEERFLGQCLESVREFVDEMVIVDTGSTDHTVEIARQFGAKVYFHQWQNSFSEARNYSLQFVNSDWVLQLDADEKLEKEDILLLKKVISDPHTNAVFMPILNDLPEGGLSKHYFPRLYRNGSAHYEGIVHNQLEFAGKSVTAEIRIYHYGYNLTPEQMAKKNERSARLLEKQLQENPDFLFTWHNLIRIHRNQKKYDLVMQEADSVLRRIPCEQDIAAYAMIAYDAASCAYQKGLYQQAEKYCLNAVKKMPDYLDIYYVLGCVWMRMKRHKAAIAEFKKALTILTNLRQKPTLTQLKLDIFDSEHLIHKHLAVCYLSLGNKTAAQRALEKSIDLKSDYFETHYLLGSLFIEENDLKSADVELSIVLEKVPEHVGALANRAVVAIRQSNFDAARKYLIQLSGLDLKDHELYNVLGELCARIKEFHLAINFYEKYLQRNPRRIDVLNNISSCYAQLGNYQAAILGYQSVLEMEPGNELARENLVGLGRYLQNHSTSDLKEAILFVSPSYKTAAGIA